MGTALAQAAPLPGTGAIPGAGAIPGNGAIPGTGARARVLGARARVLDATARCVARFGLSKTTVEDVAREARLSRATVYRLFPGGRDELVGAFVAREAAALFSGLARDLDDAATLQEVAVRFLVSLSERLAAHAPLATVLEHEPELVLPYVSFSGLDRMLAIFATFLEPYLVDRSASSLGRALETEDARRAAEWLGRLALSFMACPDGLPELASVAPTRDRDGAFSRIVLTPARIPEERARALVQNFVIPGMRELVSKQFVPDPAE